MRRLAILVFALLLAACDPVTDGAVATSVNAFRASNSVAPLVRSGELDRKASWQAARMARQRAIFHSTSLPLGVPDGWSIIGENVGAGPNVAAVMRALENSPPHRANLLDTRFTKLGVGTVTRENVVYVVEVFTG